MSTQNAILGYADSYRTMARIAAKEGKPQEVSMWSVVTDLERNMAPILGASLAREAVLQQRLTAVDERADTATSLIRRIVANFDTEIECHEDVEPNDLEHDQVLAEMRVFLGALKPAEIAVSLPACTWQRGAFSWSSSCGMEGWEFTDGGTPDENGMKFCHCCGKTLVVEVQDDE